MSTRPILSICIPNYNRPAMLVANLEALSKQFLPELTEVVIVDDCSPQSVDSDIKRFQKKHPRMNLKYYRNKTNLGFDRNVLKVISAATGKYCWLLSNDDQVLSGSLKKVVNLITKHPDASLINVNYRRFDYIAKTITAKAMVEGVRSQIFTDPNAFFFWPIPKGYFKYLGINTLTMSTDIFRREWWIDAIKHTNRFLGHNFIHEFVIAKMIKSHPKIIYVSQPQVEYLANNNRLWPNKIWQDYNNVFLGYLIEIGYDQKKVHSMSRRLKEYEFRESLTKNPLTATLIRKVLQFRGYFSRLFIHPS